MPGTDLVESCRQYYSSQGMDLTNYWKRIACYECYLGLDGMRFFAKTNNEEAYQMTRQLLEKLMGS